ncbi:L-glyceraldehyde 3-phosphate reductase [Neobacillus piezotolerans]|uniref:L-glyceraldehyde 3-phosphate reductase n=1 Tax=Neobacillus piezotolerans TaxID=2259171 RepID=A0A3D8GUW7_9BACI|nr:L-glyceraldehyde 3-phosphate reductase [Neobacillus piezotolerans]RDU38260.1 L-glyceraldehyde 3-phosphate reductase [Neobacillus piezotolerans]
MDYLPNSKRYDGMIYNRVGNSGLKLPAISLGLWHNFGGKDSYENGRAMVRRAFDLGITHFDLANNYGPPPGSAEETFGKILKQDFLGYRDEMIISTKAGYYMWPGPYGDYGSKKYLVASLDQSLKRMGLDYVDIFYHHRPDPNTPLDETMAALDLIVRQGKALYVGISNYNAEETKRAIAILKEQKTPFVIHQAEYSMLDRWVEAELLPVLSEEGAGCIAFTPLAQGLLTNKYLAGFPLDSRAAKENTFLNKNDVTPEVLSKVTQLDRLATERGQSLAQMSLSWVLRDKVVTSALIGASKVSQIEENIAALEKLQFSTDELERINDILEIE